MHISGPKATYTYSAVRLTSIRALSDCLYQTLLLYMALWEVTSRPTIRLDLLLRTDIIGKSHWQSIMNMERQILNYTHTQMHTFNNVY